MSKAMNYLLEVRGDALLPYFKFLKEAGKHLDVKTRDLISVITKVDKQTEKGLKQYLNRALNDGCTANEIIDALLMAFPTLGLTKIIWAVEIILTLNLPDFSPEMLGHEPQWNEIGKVDEIKEGQVIYKTAASRNLFIYRNKDSYKVYDSHCAHRSEDIKPDALDGLKLTCPRHKWEYDMATGQCAEHGHGLRMFAVKVDNNTIFAFW